MSTFQIFLDKAETKFKLINLFIYLIQHPGCSLHIWTLRVVAYSRLGTY